MSILIDCPGLMIVCAEAATVNPAQASKGNKSFFTFMNTGCQFYTKGQYSSESGLPVAG